MDSLTRLNSLFGGLPKPDRFVDPNHCSECAEHNDVLLNCSVETISLVELGNPGWDPICFVESIEGFKFYLPALARLSCGTGDEYYLDQFLFHLNSTRIDELSTDERTALAAFLEELRDSNGVEIEKNMDADTLQRRIAELRDSPAEKASVSRKVKG